MLPGFFDCLPHSAEIEENAKGEHSYNSACNKKEK